MKKNIFLLLGILFLGLGYISASVGIGISPSKIVLEMEEGKTQDLDILVFNTGSNPMDINLGLEGDITKISDVETPNLLIQPEPEPHQLPIKNGKNFLVKITAPSTNSPKLITGMITAVGSPAEGSQFGGSAGVGTQVEINIVPSKSIFSRISKLQITLALVLISLILIIVIFKKTGFRLRFERKIN